MTVLLSDCGESGGIIYCIQWQVFKYGLVEVAQVKGNEYMLFLFWNCREPFYGVVSTFPQVHLSCLNDVLCLCGQECFC